MDPAETPTPDATSTVTTSDVTSVAPPAPASASSYVLEISLISAQELGPVYKSMRTYAIVWIHPSRKLNSRVDQQNHNNPLWNDRFAFRVDSEFLSSEEAELTVEIYAVSWFRDVLVGTVKVLIGDLITSSARNNTRYVALQVRRPTGDPQGILNMGVALMDSANRSREIEYGKDILAKNMNHNGQKDDVYDEKPEEINQKLHLWRSQSMGSNDFLLLDEFPLKEGSVCKGSMLNGSEVCSDVGPSASIVAAEIARKSQPLPPTAEKPLITRQPVDAEGDDNGEEEHEIGNSIVGELTEEEATAKGLKPNTIRLRKEAPLPPKQSEQEKPKSEIVGVHHPRRHSDGGIFSCFAYGIEIRIVCGANNSPGTNKQPANMSKSRSNSRKKLLGSATNSS